MEVVEYSGWIWILMSSRHFQSIEMMLLEMVNKDFFSMLGYIFILTQVLEKI